MLKFLKALAVFAGTIIGVGIFGLPYVAAKAGFFVVLVYFLLMSVITIVIHLMFGKVALGTKTLHRLPGYAQTYLGTFWKKITFLVIFLGLTGALLAYLIVGGEFLRLFFSPYFGGNALIYTLFFFAAGTFLVLRGIKTIAQVEVLFLFIFFAILILFFIKGFPYVGLNNFLTADLKFLTFPYGVILFSLWGSALVPEIKEMLAENSQALRKVIISGISLAAVTYLLFIFIILGVTGDNTTKVAISGFAQSLGGGIIRLGFIFGMITCFTSFITLGLTLKKVLWYDFGLSRNLAWFIASFLPLFLFLIGLRQFIEIVSITGALALGLEAILIVFIYKEFLKKKLNQKMAPFLYILPLFFVLGVFFEIFYFIFAK